MNRIKKYLQSYGRKYNWSNMGSRFAWIAKLRCLACRIIDGANTEEYVAMELYKKSHAERKEYICMRLSQKVNGKMLERVALDERRSIGNKLRFDEFYGKAGFVKRDFLGTETASIEEIETFIKKHGEVIKKPIYLSGGAGIEVLSWEKTDKAKLEELKEADYLLEERIVQHHAIAAINSSSVNTVRIVTVLDKNKIPRVLGAALRCGGRDQLADNLHSGGVAYPIDLETGRIMCMGRDNETEQSYVTHPSSGIYMIGFEIPHWDLLVREVCDAAKLSRNMIYLGWDIAITETGVDFIEANFGHGVDTIQYDNCGKKALLRQYLEGTPCAF